jgi:hypothetical protein
MRLTFANNAIAGAFLGAVIANHQSDELYTDDLDTCTLAAHKGRVTIEIDDDLQMSDSFSVHGKDTISTLAELEQAIGAALALRPKPQVELEPDRTGTLRLASNEARNPLSRYNVCVAPKYVTVGCKTFTQEGADLVVKAARQLAAGKKFKAFTIPADKNGVGKHRVEVYPNHPTYLRFDSCESEAVASIIKLADLREKVLQRERVKAKVKAKPAVKAQPFHIFPAKAQAKRKKARKK